MLITKDRSGAEQPSVAGNPLDWEGAALAAGS